MNANKKHSSDKSGNARLIEYGLLVVIFLIIGLDLIIHKHPYFFWEKWFGFYGIYGFAACVVLVIIARFLFRPLLKRDENYYD